MAPARPLCILCGGESRRLGRDKATLPVGGQPLIAYQAERCRPYFDEVVLLSGQKTYPPSCRHVFDSAPDSGPLAGILSALQDGSNASETVAVMAVDLPAVTAETLQWLGSVTLPEEADIIIADTYASSGETFSRPEFPGPNPTKNSPKTLQPLLGIYHRRISHVLTDYLSSGNRSVMGLLRQVNTFSFPVDENEVQNINTDQAYRDLSGLW